MTTNIITPSQSDFPLKFVYIPPPNKNPASNILLLLHGLGDSELPFANLGRSLQLPQTAVMSVTAPYAVPLLDNSYMWVNGSFDMIGDVLPPSSSTFHSNLQKTRQTLIDFINVLTKKPYSYQPSSIFLLGYDQGATTAMDVGLYSSLSIGGIVSIGGVILERKEEIKVNEDTKFLMVYGEDDDVIDPDEEIEKISKLKKKFQLSIETVTLKNKNHGMPNNKTQWTPIMTFFGKNLKLRNLALESMSDVMELK
ncbi:Alpha/Beta hydrolase protein [Paraphysoderma sedebokerense]|nr:Alpha/Beta hydrolase protein [Paraphysoderma sedebokerense]